jgi:hypothetical protein
MMLQRQDRGPQDHADSAPTVHRDRLVQGARDGASGETGVAYWRTLNIGEVRVRLVVLYVVEGELDTQLKDGRTFKLTPGMSYQVSTLGDAAHRSSTQTGAKLFVVD